MLQSDKVKMFSQFSVVGDDTDSRGTLQISLFSYRAQLHKNKSKHPVDYFTFKTFLPTSALFIKT
jgi:hypothetical protein